MEWRVTIRKWSRPPRGNAWGACIGIALGPPLSSGDGKKGSPKKSHIRGHVPGLLAGYVATGKKFSAEIESGNILTERKEIYGVGAREKDIEFEIFLPHVFKKHNSLSLLDRAKLCLYAWSQQVWRGTEFGLAWRQGDEIAIKLDVGMGNA
eukprot:1388246-Amorphochlora_amoeboformis.AAC.1